MTFPPIVQILINGLSLIIEKMLFQYFPHVGPLRSMWEREGHILISSALNSNNCDRVTLPCWLVTSRSKSVTRPSLFARMMARLRSWTEMWKPSQGMAEYSMSFLNLNRTDIAKRRRLGPQPATLSPKYSAKSRAEQRRGVFKFRRCWDKC